MYAIRCTWILSILLVMVHRLNGRKQWINVIFERSIPFLHFQHEVSSLCHLQLVWRTILELMYFGAKISTAIITWRCLSTNLPNTSFSDFVSFFESCDSKVWAFVWQFFWFCANAEYVQKTVFNVRQFALIDDKLGVIQCQSCCNKPEWKHVKILVDGVL